MSTINNRSAKIIEYAQHLDSQIKGLEHTLTVTFEELARAREENQQLLRRITELESSRSDAPAKMQGEMHNGEQKS